MRHPNAPLSRPLIKRDEGVSAHLTSVRGEFGSGIGTFTGRQVAPLELQRQTRNLKEQRTKLGDSYGFGGNALWPPT